MTRGRAVSAAELAKLIGKRFGRLEILSISRETGKHAFAECACDCGSISIIRVLHAIGGAQVSCGCHRAEQSTRHGKAATSVYRCWQAMKARCGRVTDVNYPNYGGRGISVCERWHSFENFYSDMGDRPAGLSIDRINNDGNYEPGNCRWATPTEQLNNTTRSRHVIFQGQMMTVAELLKLSGCATPPRTVYGRLQKGWGVEAAMNGRA